MKHNCKKCMTAANIWSLLSSAMSAVATIVFLSLKGFEINYLCGLYATAGTLLVHLFASAWSHIKKTRCNLVCDIDTWLILTLIPTVGTTYLITGTMVWEVLLIALPIGLMTAGTIQAANTKYAVMHAEEGLKTLGHGTGKSSRLFDMEMIIPYVWTGICSMFAVLPIQTVLIFLTIPIALACASTLRKSIGQGSPMLLSDLDVRTAKLQMMFTVLLSIALIAARIL